MMADSQDNTTLKAGSNQSDTQYLSKYQEYQVCKGRGHTSSGSRWGTYRGISWTECLHCGTEYGTRTIRVERNIPQADGSVSDMEFEDSEASND